MKKPSENPNFSFMTRRVGSTTYKVKVKVFFNDTGQETMEDKILRMIRNEVPENAEIFVATKETPMVWRSERSA